MAIEASSRHNGAHHKIATEGKANKARTPGFGGLADADAGVAADFMAILATLETLDVDTTKAVDCPLGGETTQCAPEIPTVTVLAQAAFAAPVGARATVPTDVPAPLSTAVLDVNVMPPAVTSSTADAATTVAPAQAAFAASVGARATMPTDMPVSLSTTVPDANVTLPAAAASAADTATAPTQAALAAAIGGSKRVSAAESVRDGARAAMPTDMPESMAMQDTNATTKSSPPHRLAEETPDGAKTEPEANPVVVGADPRLDESVNVPLNAALLTVPTQTPPTQSLPSSFLTPPRSPTRVQTLSNANGVVSPSEVLSQVASELVAEPGRNSTKNAQADASARLTQGQVPVQTRTTDPGTSHERHVLDFMQKLADLPDLSANPQPTAFAMLATPMAIKRDDRFREQSVFKTYADDAAPLSQSMVLGPTDTFVAGAAEVVPSTDAYVAEQVSYWISNGVQNAELKLDDLGNNPVEVSIRMHGNEAHVTFRTDELQTRTALENASLHLKNLLQNEGVILSGVSVGMAGSGGTGNQQQQSQQRPRQFTTALVSSGRPGLESLDSIARRVTKNTLDLFV